MISQIKKNDEANSAGVSGCIDLALKQSAERVDLLLWMINKLAEFCWVNGFARNLFEAVVFKGFGPLPGAIFSDEKQVEDIGFTNQHGVIFLEDLGEISELVELPVPVIDIDQEFFEGFAAGLEESRSGE